jgi:hypothetical protein
MVDAGRRKTSDARRTAKSCGSDADVGINPLAMIHGDGA